MKSVSYNRTKQKENKYLYSHLNFSVLFIPHSAFLFPFYEQSCCQVKYKKIACFCFNYLKDVCYSSAVPINKLKTVSFFSENK